MRVCTFAQLMQEDPSFVPRATRYFLHDDRGEGEGEEPEAEEEAENQPDYTVPRSTQTKCALVHLAAAPFLPLAFG